MEQFKLKMITVHNKNIASSVIFPSFDETLSSFIQYKSINNLITHTPSLSAVIHQNSMFSVHSNLC